MKGVLAQLEEHTTEDRSVCGSSPQNPTFCSSLSFLISILLLTRIQFELWMNFFLNLILQKLEHWKELLKDLEVLEG